MYTYYNVDSYAITNELLAQYTNNEKEREYCKGWINSYNSTIQLLDFYNPRKLMLCALFGTTHVISIIQNDWMEFDNADKALNDFLEEHEDELFDLYEYDENPSLADELREMLLKEKEFRFCTNKNSRSVYMKKFMAQQENRRFWALTKGTKTSWERIDRLNTIVNQIYNEYRNSCYRLKVQVGEVLPDLG